MVSAQARRELVRDMIGRGMSERHSLRIGGVSASAYRYEPAQDRNCALKKKIIALAQRHRWGLYACVFDIGVLGKENVMDHALIPAPEGVCSLDDLVAQSHVEPTVLAPMGVCVTA